MKTTTTSILFGLFIILAACLSTFRAAKLPSSIYLTQGEMRTIHLNDYFSGYNTTFSLTTQAPNITLSTKAQIKDTIFFNTTSAIKNAKYMQNAPWEPIIITLNSNNSLFVYQINSKHNVSVDLQTNNMTTCFDFVYLEPTDAIIVDCLFEEETSWQNILYIANLTEGSVRNQSSVCPDLNTNYSLSRTVKYFNYIDSQGVKSYYLIRYQRAISQEANVGKIVEIFNITKGASLITQVNTSNLTQDFLLQDVNVDDDSVYLVGQQTVFTLPIAELSTTKAEKLSEFHEMTLVRALYDSAQKKFNLIAMTAMNPIIMTVQDKAVNNISNLSPLLSNVSGCTFRHSKLYIAILCQVKITCGANNNMYRLQGATDPISGCQDPLTAETNASYVLSVVDKKKLDQVFYVHSFEEENVMLSGFNSEGKLLYVTNSTESIVFAFEEPTITVRVLDPTESFDLTTSNNETVTVKVNSMKNSMDQVFVEQPSGSLTYSNFDRVPLDGLFYGAALRYNASSSAFPKIKLLIQNVEFPSTLPDYKESAFAAIYPKYSTNLKTYRVFTRTTENNWIEYNCGLNLSEKSPESTSLKCSIAKTGLDLPYSVISSTPLFDVAVIQQQSSANKYTFIQDGRYISEYTPQTPCKIVLNQDPWSYPNPYWFCVQDTQIIAFSAGNILSNATSKYSVITVDSVKCKGCDFSAIATNPSMANFLFIKCNRTVVLLDISKLEENKTQVVIEIPEKVDYSLLQNFSIIAAKNHLLIISPTQNIIQEWDFTVPESPHLRRNYPLFNYSLNAIFTYSEASNLLYLNATVNSSQMMLVYRPGYQGNGVLQYIFDITLLSIGYRFLGVSIIGGNSGFDADMVTFLSASGETRNFIVYPKTYLSYKGYSSGANATNYFNSICDPIITKVDAYVVQDHKYTVQNFIVFLMKNIQIVVNYNGIGQFSLPTNKTDLEMPLRFFFQGTIMDLGVNAEEDFPLNFTPPFRSLGNSSFSSQPADPRPIDIAIENGGANADVPWVLYDNNTIKEGTELHPRLNVSGSCKNMILDATSTYLILNCSLPDEGFSVIVANKSNISQFATISTYKSIVKMATDPKGKYLAVLLGPNLKAIAVELFSLETALSGQNVPLLQIYSYYDSASSGFKSFKFIDFFFDKASEDSNLLNMFLFDPSEGPVICQITTQPMNYNYLSNPYSLSKLLSKDGYIDGQNSFKAMHYANSVMKGSATSSFYQVIIVGNNYQSYMLNYTVIKGKIQNVTVPLCFLKLQQQRLIKSFYSSNAFIYIGLSPQGEVTLFGFNAFMDVTDITDPNTKITYKTVEHSLKVYENPSKLGYLQTSEYNYEVPVAFPGCIVGNNSEVRIHLINPYEDMFRSFAFRNTILATWNDTIYDYSNFTLHAANKAYSADCIVYISNDFFRTHLALIWTIGVTVLLFIAIIVFICKCLRSKKEDGDGDNPRNEPFVDDVFL